MEGVACSGRQLATAPAKRYQAVQRLRCPCQTPNPHGAALIKLPSQPYFVSQAHVADTIRHELIHAIDVNDALLHEAMNEERRFVVSRGVRRFALLVLVFIGAVGVFAIDNFDAHVRGARSEASHSAAGGASSTQPPVPAPRSSPQRSLLPEGSAREPEEPEPCTFPADELDVLAAYFQLLPRYALSPVTYIMRNALRAPAGLVMLQQPAVQDLARDLPPLLGAATLDLAKKYETVCLIPSTFEVPGVRIDSSLTWEIDEEPPGRGIERLAERHPRVRGNNVYWTSRVGFDGPRIIAMFVIVRLRGELDGACDVVVMRRHRKGWEIAQAVRHWVS